MTGLRASSTFARSVAVEHPESTYAIWVATTGTSRKIEESIQILRGALAHARTDINTPWRTFRLAMWESQTAEICSRTEIERSRGLDRSARGAFHSILDAQPDEVLRRRVESRLKYLDEIKSLDEP